jgi:uncharacterized protein YabN with tetrapyrrole methylase and pyrophosphatase domain
VKLDTIDLLDKVVELEKDADEFGFRWENTDQIMDQIKSECVEIGEHLQSDITNTNLIELEEEIGDLLHAVFSLCVFCKLSPRSTLEKTLKKFEWRLNTVKQLAIERGLTNLNGFAFDELMVLWDEAKQLGAQQPGS